MVIIRMVGLIVVRSLNAGRAKMASVRIVDEFRALMCKRDRVVVSLHGQLDALLVGAR
jgi:hypothetical protein